MTSETDTLLHVSGLRKTYRTGRAELVAVDDLSFSVRGKAARLARAKVVQIVFQDPYLSLDARISIGATVDGVLRLHGLTDRADRAARTRELLAQVGLGEREAAALPRRLSGDQRRYRHRCSISCATSAATPASAWSSSATTWPSCDTCATRRSFCTGAARWNTVPSRTSSPTPDTPTHTSVARPGWDPDSISGRRREHSG
ncbi:hypothetical protein [Streptomyces sp. DASNCL29]|uniref:hypothetical protein n=1 Tax=Streptomyces sp. DASNCL29 TaxID=2583819 RepID=UPI003211E2B3